MPKVILLRTVHNLTTKGSPLSGWDPNSFISRINEARGWGFPFKPEDVAVTPIALDAQSVDSWVADISTLVQGLMAHEADYHGNVTEGRFSLHYRNFFSGSAHCFARSMLRPDGIVVGGQLKLLELNVDSGIGGINEHEFIQSLCRPMARDSIYFPSPQDALRGFIENQARRIRADGDSVRIALVLYDDSSDDDYAVVTQLCDWISDLGCVGVYGLSNVPNDANLLVRAATLMHADDRVASMLRIMQSAVSRDVLLLNPIADLRIEDKGALAYCFQHRDRFDAPVAAAISRLIPTTLLMEDAKVRLDGDVLPLKKYALARKDGLVLKRLNSRVGQHVRIGRECASQEWSSLIDAACANPKTSVLQELLESEAYPLQFLLPGTGQTKVYHARAVISPFIFGGVFGGAFARVEKDPTRRVLSAPFCSQMRAASVGLVQRFE